MIHDPFTYMQPPQIQLGFYWDDYDDRRRFQDILTWLEKSGCTLHPVAQVALLEGKTVPWFTQLAMAPQLKLTDKWHGSNLVAPVCVRGKSPELVEFDFGYALASVATDSRPLEIVASGLAINLLENSQQKAAGKTRKKAKRTEKWLASTFQGVCESLSPLYATKLAESALLTPSCLVNSCSFTDIRELFLSNQLVGERRFATDPFVEAISTYRWTNGHHVKWMLKEWDEEKQEAFVNEVKSVFREYSERRMGRET